jgi:predicted esterase
MELGLATVPPAEGHTHDHTLIFLHGRGGTGRDLADALVWARGTGRRTLREALPGTRLVFPQAPELPCENREGDEWPQWFDIWNILDPGEREDLQAPGLHDSVAAIRRLIRAEATRVGGLHRVVLAGFSQGGATAVHTLLNLEADAGHDYSKAAGSRAADGAVRDGTTSSSPPAGSSKSQAPLRLAAFLGLSSWMPFPGGTLEETREVLGLQGTPSDEILRHTPVFLGHCADDPLVFPEYGRQLRDALIGFDLNVTWREYKLGGHWLNAPQGVDDILAFLEAVGVEVGTSLTS